MAHRWLRTKLFQRDDKATVMEGIRDDGAHIGFAHNRQLDPQAARALLDRALEADRTVLGPVDKHKGEDGWVEEPDASA